MGKGLAMSWKTLVYLNSLDTYKNYSMRVGFFFFFFVENVLVMPLTEGRANKNRSSRTDRLLKMRCQAKFQFI